MTLWAQLHICILLAHFEYSFLLQAFSGTVIEKEPLSPSLIPHPVIAHPVLPTILERKSEEVLSEASEETTKRISKFKAARMQQTNQVLPSQPKLEYSCLVSHLLRLCKTICVTPSQLRGCPMLIWHWLSFERLLATLKKKKVQCLNT